VLQQSLHLLREVQALLEQLQAGCIQSSVNIEARVRLRSMLELM